MNQSDYSTDDGASARAALAEVRRSLAILYEPGDVVELRILNTRQGTVSGYFDNMDRLAAAAAYWSGRAPAVYVTLNPVLPDLLARSANRLKGYARETTSDAQILCRRWLPLDFDPVRPSGISATDQEKAAALERALACRGWLAREDWPEPILADSGNGSHLLYRIEQPNTPESRELIRRVLLAVAFRFDDDRVTVDKTTFNAARIWKLYGTASCKGDSLPERPHRPSALLKVP